MATSKIKQSIVLELSLEEATFLKLLTQNSFEPLESNKTEELREEIFHAIDCRLEELTS